MSVYDPPRHWRLFFGAVAGWGLHRPISLQFHAEALVAYACLPIAHQLLQRDIVAAIRGKADMRRSS